MIKRISLDEIDRRGRPVVVEVVLHDLSGVKKWKVSLHIEDHQYVLTTADGTDMGFEDKDEAMAFCRNHFSHTPIVVATASG